MAKRPRKLRILALFVALTAAWLLWSGIYKPLLLWLGIFSCILTVYLAHRVGFFQKTSGLHLIPKVPGYWIWLLREITRSSLDVARIVLDPKLPISPSIVYIDAEPKGPVGQVILSNAITLAPGTVTLDVFENTICVHCLTRESAEAIESGEANRLTARLTTE